MFNVKYWPSWQVNLWFSKLIDKYFYEYQNLQGDFYVEKLKK